MSRVNQVISNLTRRYKLDCQNRYQIGRQYSAASDITAVIGSFTAGVVTAEYAWSSSAKVYTPGTLHYHALSMQGIYVVGTMYPLNDDNGQAFVDNPYNYTPKIGDFVKTIPTEGVLYRFCQCRVYGVYLDKDRAITKKYKYKSCKMVVYSTELVFPDVSGQASVGSETNQECWKVCSGCC